METLTPRKSIDHQKIADSLEIILSILEEGNVTLRKSDPFDFGYLLDERGHYVVLSSLFGPVRDESRTWYAVEAINHGPSSQ